MAVKRKRVQHHSARCTAAGGLTCTAAQREAHKPRNTSNEGGRALVDGARAQHPPNMPLGRGNHVARHRRCCAGGGGQACAHRPHICTPQGVEFCTLHTCCTNTHTRSSGHPRLPLRPTGEARTLKRLHALAPTIDGCLGTAHTTSAAELAVQLAACRAAGCCGERAAGPDRLAAAATVCCRGTQHMSTTTTTTTCKHMHAAA